jgi:serine/threonine-protein phosphatase 2A regulatory subunit B
MAAEGIVLDWRLSQVFGGDKPVGGDDTNDADVVSAIEFDDTGEYLAAGDRGGRVVLFERDESKPAPAAAGAKPKKTAEALPRVEYKFYTEFQSHESEFDYLKSLEIEEKINKIRFLRRQSDALLLLSTNDKTIKLWKVYPKKIRAVSPSAEAKPAELRVPQVQVREVVPTAQPRRVFANAHAYHINSISVSSDQETYLSADDLRINLWSLKNTSESFNIVDIKPANMEELSEVITSAEFHPLHCHEFIYSSSKGMIKMGDLRAAALCDRHAKVFQEEEDPSTRSFFSEIISSISDVKFSRCGRYILSRDYLTAKLWDVNMERKPVKVVKIHEHLRSKLCDLYENDCIFDKFECAINHDATQIATGSYSRQFHIYDTSSKAEVMLQAAKIQQRVTSKKPKVKAKKGGKGDDEGSSAVPTGPGPESTDFTRKALHVAFHPRQNVLAVAAHNNLFLFTSP